MAESNSGRTGRPTVYKATLAQAICERIAEGESLRSICLSEGMPDRATIFRWLADDTRAEFRDQYARARETQAELLAEEIIEIADESSRDYTTNADGQEIVNHDHIARSRLRVDARKWFAGKVAPKKYGDRMMNEHSGPDGGPIPQQMTATIVLTGRPDAAVPAAKPAPSTKPTTKGARDGRKH